MYYLIPHGSTAHPRDPKGQVGVEGPVRYCGEVEMEPFSNCIQRLSDPTVAMQPINTLSYAQQCPERERERERERESERERKIERKKKIEIEREG